MNDLELAIRLELERRGYTQGLRDASTETKRFSGTTGRALQVIDRGMGRLATRWTALAAGIGGVQAVRGVAALETRMTRLGIQANISAEQVDELKRQVFEVSQDRDISINPDQLLSAVESIIEKTGDLDFAQDNLRNLAVAIQATGAEGAAIGEITAEFQKMGLVARRDVAEALDILTVQGKEGAFTLQNLAALGPRVVTAYTALGREGIPAIRELGASLQVIRQGTGNAEQAATAFEAVLRTMSDAQKIKLLQGNGIQIFDAEALKENREVLRPINEIMVDILKATGGKRSLLSSVFDAEAIRAFNALNSEFARTGGTASIEKFLNVVADGSTIVADSKRAASDAGAAWTSVMTAFREFADRELTAPLKEFAEFIRSLDKATLDRWLTLAKWLGIGVTGLLAGRALIGAGKDLVGAGRFIFGKRGQGAAGGTGGALGGAIGSMTPVPVWVVNMGGMPGVGGVAGRTARTAKTFSKLKTGAALLGGTSVRALPMLGAGALGTAGAATAGAGAVGVGVGTLIDKILQRFEAGLTARDSIGRAIARPLALLGNDNARASLQAEGRGETGQILRDVAQQMAGVFANIIGQGALAKQLFANSNTPNEPSELHIKIESDAPAKVKSLRGRNRQKIDVETGTVMPSVGRGFTG